LLCSFPKRWGNGCNWILSHRLTHLVLRFPLFVQIDNRCMILFNLIDCRNLLATRETIKIHYSSWKLPLCWHFTLYQSAFTMNIKHFWEQEWDGEEREALCTGSWILPWNMVLVWGWQLCWNPQVIKCWCWTQLLLGSTESRSMRYIHSRNTLSRCWSSWCLFHQRKGWFWWATAWEGSPYLLPWKGSPNKFSVAVYAAALMTGPDLSFLSLKREVLCALSLSHTQHTNYKKKRRRKSWSNCWAGIWSEEDACMSAIELWYTIQYNFFGIIDKYAVSWFLNNYI
jgi:hypothetical protein